jgi:hypothetical protein
MNKKKWALVILLVLTVFGWYKLFYKTYNINAVAQNADAIVAIDVKRITNTIIWQFITTPSQWKISSRSSKKDATINWKDVIELPDYILAFHVKNQPNNVWHTKFTIKSGIRVDRALNQYNFKAIGNNEYINEEMGVYIFYTDNQILISSLTAENKVYAKEVVDELFTQKKFIAKETLSKLIAAKSHLAALFTANTFLQEDAIVKANFDKEKISINSTFKPQPKYTFTENDFLFSSNALLALHFTQPTPSVYNLLDDVTKQKISKALNFNADSLFLVSSKNYQLHLNNFVNRVDSAITYTYDDEFNKIEKVVVNNVQEPVYNFTVNGDSVNRIYSYWQQSKVIEQTASGNLFTAMPFVKSYCSVLNNQLSIQPFNYTTLPTNNNFKGVLYLQILLDKIPANLLNYLPNDVTKVMGNLENVKISAQNKNKEVVIGCVVQKKKNDLPILKF